MTSKKDNLKNKEDLKSGNNLKNKVNLNNKDNLDNKDKLKNNEDLTKRRTHIKDNLMKKLKKLRSVCDIIINGDIMSVH